MSYKTKSHSLVVLVLSAVIVAGLVISAFVYFSFGADKALIAQEIWAHFKSLSLFAAGYAFRSKAASNKC